jgi:hypothetical protein
MGHIRLGTLPKTQKWDQVVGLIAGGADVGRIAGASADAAEHGLERAAHPPRAGALCGLLTGRTAMSALRVVLPNAAVGIDAIDPKQSCGPSVKVRSVAKSFGRSLN